MTCTNKPKEYPTGNDSVSDPFSEEWRCIDTSPKLLLLRKKDLPKEICLKNIRKQDNKTHSF